MNTWKTASLVLGGFVLGLLISQGMNAYAASKPTKKGGRYLVEGGGESVVLGNTSLAFFRVKDTEHDQCFIVTRVLSGTAGSGAGGGIAPVACDD